MNNKTFNGKTEAEIINRNWKRNSSLRACFSEYLDDKPDLRQNMFRRLADSTRSVTLKSYALSKAA